MEQPTRSQRWRESLRCTWNDLFSVVLRVRFWLLVLGHSAIFSLSLFLVFLLRFDFQWPANAAQMFWHCLPAVVGIKLVCFYLLRSFHGWWRYIAFSDLRVLAKATATATIVLVIADHFVLPFQIPRSVLIVDSVFAFVMIGSVRSSWRLMHEEIRPLISGARQTRTVLVGTSDSVVKLAHHLRSYPHLGHRLLGFIASNDQERRTWIANLPVLSNLNELPTLVVANQIQEILVPAGELSGAQMRQLTSITHGKLKVLPRIEDYFRGSGRIPVRDVDINDLLRRDPVVLDDTTVRELVEDRRIMVSGAGGSIGSEICRQVIRYAPRELLLLGRGENRIFAIERELSEQVNVTKLIPLIGDVTDSRRMRDIFEEYRPEILFHAAAHKHVPLMEANVGEAIKNNLLGTRCLADLASEYDVRSFVLISTDKAVNPTSVMGATKNLAERYVNANNQRSSTQFVVVRFGNVLGSAGSVVPIFREQIENGGPITVTDERMRRYFMTIPEASRLVLQAAAMGKGGEIFVLDMGEPIQIVDLARDMIRLSGLPDSAIEITFSGIRPGEKLFEELYFSDEETVATDHVRLRAALHRTNPVEADWEELERTLAQSPTNRQLKEWLSQLIPEYQCNDLVEVS
jgi:FlaA1/EpsC-like NDP-sugar epimerase